jgi:hypothetical protein
MAKSKEGRKAKRARKQVEAEERSWERFAQDEGSADDRDWPRERARLPRAPLLAAGAFALGLLARPLIGLARSAKRR